MSVPNVPVISTTYSSALKALTAGIDRAGESESNCCWAQCNVQLAKARPSPRPYWKDLPLLLASTQPLVVSSGGMLLTMSGDHGSAVQPYE